MFRNLLSDSQWKAFIVLVYKVALADHRVPLPEGLFVDELKSEAGFEDSLPAMEVLGAADLEPFRTRESRIVVMLNLLCLAFSDEDFHINETTVLIGLARSFGFSDEEYLELVGRGKRQAQLMGEAGLIVNRAAG